MKHVNCPKCGKQLIRLEPYDEFAVYEFWCDNCNLDITILDNDAIDQALKDSDPMATIKR